MAGNAADQQSAGLLVRVPHLVFVGLPGAGKTTIARSVATRLGRPFVDLDAEIEDRSGKTVAQIFETDGEAAFRAWEVSVSQSLAGASGMIVAPGGGWVANREAVAHLRPFSRIIYLRVSPEGALRRMGRGIVRRPLLCGDDPLAILRSIYDSRRSLYETADLTVNAEVVGRQRLIERVVELALPYLQT